VLATSDLEDDDGNLRKVTDRDLRLHHHAVSRGHRDRRSSAVVGRGVAPRNPDQRQILVDDPGVIPNALEETLRYAPSPVRAG
jgi:cytochrome P450